LALAMPSTSKATTAPSSTQVMRCRGRTQRNSRVSERIDFGQRKPRMIAGTAWAQSGRIHVTEFGRRVLGRTDLVVDARVKSVRPPFRGVSTARLEVDGLDRWSMLAGLGFGAGLVILSFTRSLATAFPVLVLVGVAFIIQLASVNTLLQTLVPDRLRGRVMSLNSSLLLGIFPLSGLAAGALADRFGEPLVIGVGGSLVMLGAVLLGRRLMERAPASLARARELELEEELAELAEDPA